MPNERPLREEDIVAPVEGAEGAEGGEGGEGTAAAERTRIKIKGRDFEVSADLAAALQEREGDVARKVSEQGEELGQLRRLVLNQAAAGTAGGAPGPASAELTDDEYYAKIQDLMLEDPVAAEKLREQRIERRYSRDQAHRELRSNWRARLDGFYADNPDLSKDEDLVDLTYQTLARTDPEVASLVKQGNFDAVFERVADATRKRILGYAGRRGDVRATNQGGRVAVTESGGGVRGGSRSAPAEEDEGPKSVSAVIKAKQARHKGAYSGAAKRDYRPKPGSE